MDGASGTADAVYVCPRVLATKGIRDADGRRIVDTLGKYPIDTREVASEIHRLKMMLAKWVFADPN
ncbi:hypothetical protein [Ereboglobus luteus]|uniref:Uncharacterized protein n=1 Tax=Ereboglobus luteus TaxID=1796921 RepID=A0A2U8E5P7_9BACT|nr:hypothetical protein [Ereboglobus luteus]AWI10183.1 hypothetical protein CKA38_13770 [Ereboglobus luteus]